MNQIQWLMPSPIGPLHLVASAKGLQGIYWKKQKAPLAKHLKGASPELQVLNQAVQELTLYFQGSLSKFTVPLDLIGTDFQKQVWSELRKIPYGKTWSYKDLAKKIKNEKAYRAVGTANGKNPVSIIIPCHRVIAASGHIGGYAGGVHIKTQLLDLEKSHPSTQ